MHHRLLTRASSIPLPLLFSQGSYDCNPVAQVGRDGGCDFVGGARIGVSVPGTAATMSKVRQRRRALSGAIFPARKAVKAGRYSSFRAYE